MSGAERRTSRRHRCLVALVAIGLALAAAPAVFGMFTRAPKGGDMIEDFRPHMTEETITRFRGYLDEIEAAKRELDDFVATSGGTAVDDWRRQWPAIDTDMTSMLATMETNLGRFRGVSALPPFPLFPWFFVVPGLLIAALGAAGLRRGEGDTKRRLVVVVAVVGVGLVAAPAVFQMFSRAPGGARMIDDFRSFMSTDKVTDVQRYFIVIGAGEAELRTTVVPEVERATSGGNSVAASRAFIGDWPRISNEMAPMIGAMADNVDNYAAVDALPPFWLLPWFFALPGLMVVALAAGARPRDGRPAEAPTTTTLDHVIDRSTT